MERQRSKLGGLEYWCRKDSCGAESDHEGSEGKLHGSDGNMFWLLNFGTGLTIYIPESKSCGSCK